MQDPTQLYDFAGGIDARTLRARTLVVTVTSFVDAGRSQQQFDEHVRKVLPHQLVAIFDMDQLVDYRGQRPAITFERDRFVDYQTSQLKLTHLIDESGVPFLLLSGPEPDLQWERLAKAVAHLVDTFQVQNIVFLAGMPMAVPHTRPVAITRHASDPSLIPGNEPFFNTVQMGASFPAMLEYRLGEQGRAVIGLTAHVPHYVAQAEYPAATIALTQGLSEATGLTIPVSALELRAGEVHAQIGEELEQADEARMLVEALEEQYDAASEGRPVRSLGAAAENLPTADDIAREAEAFLRQHNEGEDPPKDQPPHFG